MGKLGMVVGFLAVVVICVMSGRWVGAEEVQHLVGGDRGWDPSTNILAWSSSSLFRVGDTVWFAYSKAEGKIAELKTKDEYESCNVTNPIKMYTDGLNSIKLQEEGIRYFVSTNSHHCKSGLKLNVEVFPSDAPKVITSESAALEFAPEPAPSGSSLLAATWLSTIAGVFLFYSLVVSV